MGNKTFYISPDNEEHLKQETNKSGLINRLLAEHYEGKGTLQGLTRKVQKIIADPTPPVTNKEPVLEQKPENPAQKFCPAGHSINLATRRCFGKGCKYS